MPSKSSRNPSDRYGDNAILNELCNLACDKLESYLDYFSLDLRRYGKRYIGRCPVHGGSSSSGVNLYPDGYAVRGNWECHSNKCEKAFTRTLIGFTKGIMSHEHYGWGREGDRTVTTKAAVDEICKFLGVSLGDVKVDGKKVARRSFIHGVEVMSPEGRPAGELCSREVFHRWHRIPSSYYLSRGYEERTLAKFEVGENICEQSPNFGRTSVPIYNEDGTVIIGVLCRSPHPRCPKCSFCHLGECPPCSRGDAPFSSVKKHLRWVVQPDGFNDKHHLYNLWRARKRIVTSRCIVLVEGAGDVWRLDEAGVQNAVALMGSKLSGLQDVMIEECSPSHVVIMTDDDDAGNAAAEQIEAKWRRLAKVHRIKPEGGDLGDMTTADVKNNYRRIIEGYMK